MTKTDELIQRAMSDEGLVIEVRSIKEAWEPIISE